MVFKEFLTLDEAEIYLQKKQNLPVEFEDLQHLERTAQIKPVVYFTETMFCTDIFVTDFSDKPIVSGYFKPSKFILLDRFRVNPYREYANQFFYIEDFDFFEVVQITEHSMSIPSTDNIGQVYEYNQLDDKGVNVNEIPYLNVFIRRSELDALLRGSEHNEDDNTIDQLNQRIKQLEQQLEQSSQQSNNTSTPEYTTDAIEALNAVVDKYWLDYDPELKNHTKQYTIKEWIKENYPMITDSMALWIDRIARHPKAK